jgi:chemotaxis protein histidine kinase CheA
MHEDHKQLDDELARIAHSVRGGKHMLACLQLAEFALKLDRFLRREERALAFACRLLPASGAKALSKTRVEHASLRQLVSAIATALDGADDHRGLDSISKLRSVLLLHIAKEEVLLAPPSSHAVH